RPRARRGGRRHDECAQPACAAGLRPAVRCRQRGAVPRPRTLARARGGERRGTESARRRRHARRPAPAAAPRRPANAGGADGARAGDPRVKVVVLSGGVGGARFVRGVVDVLDPSDVTVIGNVGDDVDVLGVHVSPDLDSNLYALAGVNDEERGWGRSGETWQALETVANLAGEAWFRLGDRDLGL